MTRKSGRRKNNAGTHKEEEKKLAGTLAKKELPAEGCSRTRVRKSRYGRETLQFPIHCCDVMKPPYLFSGELYTSPLHSKHLFVYTVCSRRSGQCFAVLRTR